MVSPQQSQGPGAAMRFWESCGWIRHIFFQKVFDKIQAYTSPKNVNKMEDFVGIWDFKGVVFSTCHGTLSLLLKKKVKKGHT